MTEKESFIEACFSENIIKFYKENVDPQKLDFWDEEKITHKYWLPSKNCCQTGELLTKDNMDIKIGYWTPFIWKPVRKDLKKEVMKKEALLCQEIDCSCNDCLHFQRTNGKKGICISKNIPVTAWVSTCHPQNQQCFKHRLKK